MKARKKIPKTILNRITAINEMLPAIYDLDEIPMSYAGGTWPYYIDISAPIEVKNQFVYIKEVKGSNSFNFEKRYNANDYWQLDELKYSLTIIKRAFNKALKNK